TLFPADKLQSLIHLKPGEPANAVQLEGDAEEIVKLYGSKGYLFAHIDPTPEMDDSAATVAYQINVTEGDHYHMGELTIAGLPPASAAKVVEQWQRKQGNQFDD